jgi:hypothetical protein
VTALDKAGLVALADRVEALTKECGQTDREIFAALGTHVFEKRDRDKKAWWYPVDDSKWSPRIDDYLKIPRYTASLDAAMTLVPEGHEWLRKCPDTMTVYRAPENDKAWAVHIDASGATPALALTAAALRATQIEGADDAG